MMLRTDSDTAILNSQCAICGKKLKITVYPNKTYEGGHYFGKIDLNNNKTAEYWEYNRCYSN